jgi:hypothetical protein
MALFQISNKSRSHSRRRCRCRGPFTRRSHYGARATQPALRVCVALRTLRQPSARRVCPLVRDLSAAHPCAALAAVVRIVTVVATIVGGRGVPLLGGGSRRTARQAATHIARRGCLVYRRRPAAQHARRRVVHRGRLRGGELQRPVHANVTVTVATLPQTWTWTYRSCRPCRPYRPRRPRRPQARAAALCVRHVRAPAGAALRRAAVVAPQSPQPYGAMCASTQQPT